MLSPGAAHDPSRFWAIGPNCARARAANSKTFIMHMLISVSNQATHCITRHLRKRLSNRFCGLYMADPPKTPAVPPVHSAVDTPFPSALARKKSGGGRKPRSKQVTFPSPVPAATLAAPPSLPDVSQQQEASSGIASPTPLHANASVSLTPASKQTTWLVNAAVAAKTWKRTRSASPSMERTGITPRSPPTGASEGETAVHSDGDTVGNEQEQLLEGLPCTIATMLLNAQSDARSRRPPMCTRATLAAGCRTNDDGPCAGAHSSQGAACSFHRTRSQRSR